MRKIYLIIFVIAFIHSVSFGAPVITNVTGTTTRTITGTSLMNENTAGWKFTASRGSFEGSSASADGFVCYIGDCAYDTNVHLLGNKSLRSDAASGGGATCGTGYKAWQADSIYHYDASGGGTAYWRYYFRYDSNMSQEFAGLNYWKIAYFLYGNYYWDWVGSGRDSIQLKAGATATYVDTPEQISFDRWYCLEGYASNGTESVWLDGVFLGSYTGSGTTNPTLLIVPMTNGCVTTATTPSGQFYTDGFMVSTSRVYPSALVVLGNNSNYSSATKVVQPLTNISETSISFTYSETGYSPSGSTVSSMSGTDRYVWVIDNRQSLSNPYTISGGGAGDTTPPTVTAFTIPSTSDSLTISISSFTASDDTAVTGYLLTESGTTPSVSDPLWQSSAWTAYTFSSEGSKTLYAWAKDAAGNISSSLNDSVTITLPSDTCEDDAALCTTEGDCTTYWPAYNWCGNVCQSAACDSPILSESFEDNSYASRGWYDNTNHGTIVAGGYSGNCLQWAWTAGNSTPTNGASARHLIDTNGEIFVQFYVKFDTDWRGSQESYHPHLFTIPSNYDAEYCPLAANYLQTYIEFSSDIGSPYEVRPAFAFQDLYRVNTGLGTPPVDIESTTENRSTFYCNQTVTPTPLFNECYSAGSGYYYSAALWKDTNYEITKNVWHKIEVYIKMNTISGSIGQNDGIFKEWVDGNLVIDYSNLLLRTNQYPDMTWAQFVLSPYISIPPSGSPYTQTMWVDELKIYSTAQTPVSQTPVMVSVSVDTTAVSVTTDVSTSWTGYDANDCQLSCTTAGTVNLTSPSGSGTDWSLTAASSIGYGDTCTMACTFGADDVEAVSGGTDMESFSGFGVAVNTQDTTTPIPVMTTDPQNFTYNYGTISGTCSDDNGVSWVKWAADQNIDADNGTLCSGTTTWSCDLTSLPRGFSNVYIGCSDASDNVGLTYANINSVFLPAQRGIGGRGIVIRGQ